MSHNRQKSEAERNSHHPHTSKFMITFKCLIIAARHINAKQAMMFYCCRLFIIFFRQLISTVSQPIFTSFCHKLGGATNMKMYYRNLGAPPPVKNLGAKKLQNLGTDSYTFAI